MQKFLLLIIPLIFTLASCKSKAGSTTSAPPPPPPVNVDVPPSPMEKPMDIELPYLPNWYLLQGAYKIVRVQTRRLDTDHGATFILEPGANRLNGNTGCNQYFGEISFSGTDDLRISKVGASEKYCSPDEIMKVEQEIFTALAKVRKWKSLNSNEIAFLDEVGVIQLSLTRK